MRCGTCNKSTITYKKFYEIKKIIKTSAKLMAAYEAGPAQSIASGRQLLHSLSLGTAVAINRRLHVLTG